MKIEITNRLLSLNDEFYSTQAGTFSATRRRVQPGVARSLTDWAMARGGFDAGAGWRLLDLGCGNGNLAAWLTSEGFRGWYTGVDQSSGLLDQAGGGSERCQYLAADLSKADWLVDLPVQPFDLVTCFATLHHLPGMGLRLRLLREVKRLLGPDGTFIVSCWQIRNSPRLVKRIQPWERIGMNPADVDEEDVLLDWRADDEGAGEVLRYVHLFTEAELAELAGKSSFKVNSSWLSDGKEGNLGLYQVWSRA